MARAANSAYPRFTTFTPFVGGVDTRPAVTPRTGGINVQTPINQFQINRFARASHMRMPSTAGQMNRNAAAVAEQTAGVGSARAFAGTAQAHQPIMAYAQQRANERTDRVRSEQKRREENTYRHQGFDDAYTRDDPGLAPTGAAPGVDDPGAQTLQQRWQAMQGEVTPAQPVANFAHSGIQTVNPADVATHTVASQAANDAARRVAASPRFGTETASGLVIPAAARPSVRLRTSSPRFSNL